MDKKHVVIWGTALVCLGAMILSIPACDVRRKAPVTKEVGPPARPIPYEPSDRSTGGSVTTLLKWMTAKRATSYDIYFGKTNPPPFVADTDSTSCDPGLLEYSTTYYWRIDAKNDHGTTEGPIYIFTTLIEKK